MIHRREISYLGLAILVALVPLVVTDNYLLHLFIMTSIWVMLSTNFNVILSAGQLSLGQIAFFGIGAYTSGILAVKLQVPFLAAMLAGGVFSALMGLFIGRITLKMRGSHFVLVTFAFGEICRLVATNWVKLTNGPMGLRNIPPPAIEFTGTFRFDFTDFRSQCYLALVLTLATISVAYRLRYSRYGRAFTALKSAEDLAESVGISHYKFVTMAVLTSTFLTGLTGSFYAHYTALVSPEIFAFANMVNLLIMVIGGGRNSIAGPMVGALVFTLLPEFLRAFQVYRMLLFGALLTLIVIFMPQGIVPRLWALWKRVFGDREKKESFESVRKS